MSWSASSVPPPLGEFRASGCDRFMPKLCVDVLGSATEIRYKAEISVSTSCSPMRKRGQRASKQQTMGVSGSLARPAAPAEISGKGQQFSLLTAPAGAL